MDVSFCQKTKTNYVIWRFWDLVQFDARWWCLVRAGYNQTWLTLAVGSSLNCSNLFNTVTKRCYMTEQDWLVQLKCLHNLFPPQEKPECEQQWWLIGNVQLHGLDFDWVGCFQVGKHLWWCHIIVPVSDNRHDINRVEKHHWSVVFWWYFCFSCVNPNETWRLLCFECLFFLLFSMCEMPARLYYGCIRAL